MKRQFKSLNRYDDSSQSDFNEDFITEKDLKVSAKELNTIKSLLEKDCLKNFSNKKKKAYFDKLKKQRSQIKIMNITKKLGKRFKIFFKHPRMIKIQQEFNRINEYVNKIKKKKTVSHHVESYCQTLMQEKSHYAKAKKIKEINLERNMIKSERNYMENTWSLKHIKSFDDISKSNIHVIEAKEVKDSESVHEDNNISHMFITGIIDSHDIESHDNSNAKGNTTSNIIEESTIDIQPQKNIIDNSQNSLKQLMSKVKTTTSFLGMISKDESPNNSCLNTERMPQINNGLKVFDPNDRSKSTFKAQTINNK